LVEFWSVLIGGIGKMPFEFYRLPKVKDKSAKADERKRLWLREGQLTYG